MDARDLSEVGFPANPEEQVLRLALLAKDSGLDGVVCSPREARLLREHCGPGFVLVTPGVRPSAAAADDQARIATPAEAIAAGAHYLVIGRPITQAADPVDALASIIAETGQ
jgi:orotidine-5'-phosphate decarboxylase